MPDRGALVEPIEWPATFAQSMLAKANACRRAGYLYAKYRGIESPSEELLRGTAVHMVAERILTALVSTGQRSLLALHEGESKASAAGELASFTRELVAEVREESKLPLSAAGWDDVRQMAWHLGVAIDVDPEKVVAIERPFHYVTPGGQVVTGRIDLALLSGEVADVRDFKTQWMPPDQAVFERAYQGRLYAGLLLFGRPGRPDAPEPPLGEHVQWVRIAEVFPRHLTDQGDLVGREFVASRQEIRDFMDDVDALVADLEERKVSGDFPAVRGSHCNQCPCKPECPLPEQLRAWHGSINSVEQAAEAAEWADAQSDLVAATNRELKAFADAHGGEIRYGVDMARRFETSEKRSVKRKGRGTDWDGLEEAIVRAAEWGEPFDLGEWLRTTTSTNFKTVRLSPAELGETNDEEAGDGSGTVAAGVGSDDDGRSADERWGAAPF